MTAAIDLTDTATTIQFMLNRGMDVGVNAISLYYGGVEVTATVAVTSANLVLVHGAVTTTISLTAGATDTLTEMVAAINAVAGWYAKLLGPAAALSNTLSLCPATSVVGVANTMTLAAAATWMIDQLVTSASQLVCNRIDDTIKSASYTEYRSGGHRLYVLEHRPVTAITRVSYGWNDSIRVYCANASFTRTRATIANDGTNVTLVHVASGVTTTTPLALAASPTIAQLVTAINAVGSGWTAEAMPNWGSYPTADLVPSAPTSCLDIDRGYAYLRSWQYEGSPIAFSADEGWVELADMVPNGASKLRITYTAGYSTVPLPLQQAVWRLVTKMWDSMGRDTMLQSERLADYSWTAKDHGYAKDMDAMLDSEIMALIQPYIDYGFGDSTI